MAALKFEEDLHILSFNSTTNYNFYGPIRLTDIASIMLCMTSFFVCLSVCEQDISQNYRWIRAKLGGHVGCVKRTNLFNFGEDPDPDTRIMIFFF